MTRELMSSSDLEPRVQIRVGEKIFHSKNISRLLYPKKSSQMKLYKLIEKDNSEGEQMNGEKKRVSFDFVSYFLFKSSLPVLFMSECTRYFVI